MKLRLAIALCVAACQIATDAATWYVDASATGANNGTNWTDAYTALSSVDRDAGVVSAGDTVNISGGDYGGNHLVYDFKLKEGTSGSWTTYQSSTEPGHNGEVTWHGKIIIRNFTHLFGQKRTSQQTNIVSTYDVESVLRTNCNFFVNAETNNPGTIEQNGDGNAITLWTTPVDVKWMHFRGSTNVDTIPRNGSQSVIHSDDSTLYGTNELAYLWVDQSSGHGAGGVFGIGGGTNFGAANIHHCLIETNWSDICIAGEGLDFHHNIIQKRMPPNGANQQCNDTFTISGSYTRIYNNVMESGDNTLGYYWISGSNIHDFYFYGNIIKPVDAAHAMSPVQHQGSAVWEQSAIACDHQMTNIVIANNTVILGTNGGSGALVSMITRGDYDPVEGFTLRAVHLRNNLFATIDGSTISGALSLWPAAVAPSGNGGTNQYGKGFAYTTNELKVGNNMFWTTSTETNSPITWDDQTLGHVRRNLTNSTQMMQYLGITNYTTVPVSFMNAASFDFRPTIGPIDKGVSFADWSAVMTDVGVDLYGNARGAGEGWDIGAVEVVGSLVLWLTFAQDDGWTTNHVITDRSGYGNHAYYMPSTNRNTWPTWTNGPNTLDAAQFVVNLTNGGGFRQGTYAAITSLSTNALASGLGSFTNATWALWASINTEHLQQDIDDQFLTTGQDINNWFFGKYYSDGVQFSKTQDAGQEPLDTYSRWPNLTNSDWHHYAITWNGATLTPYLDGVAYTSTLLYTNANSFTVTNSFPGVMSSTNSAIPAWSYIALGVNNHSGTPDPDDSDGLPNNGQLWGKLADIRIYNRALTASEVATIAGTTNSTPETPTPAGFRVLNFGGKVLTSGGKAVGL